MNGSEDFKITAANLKRLGQKKLTKEERQKRQRALDKLGIPGFAEFIKMKKEEKNIKGITITVKFLIVRTPENFALIYLKLRKRGQTLLYFVIKMHME